ncbi:MAG: hypothetical protein JSV89_11680 [Spirochaetaceae bacterium]|nr:MAG: hypothetical protein JSV89_11680 [Spirochaetaceae bacterium]
MQKNRHARQLLLLLPVLLACVRISAESPFSSVYGVTLGRTTTAEFSRLGEKVTKTYTATGEPYRYYVINEIRFYDDEGETLAAYVSFLENDPFPSKWAAVGIDWQHSFDDWLSLFHKLGLPDVGGSCQFHSRSKSSFPDATQSWYHVEFLHQVRQRYRTF